MQLLLEKKKIDYIKRNINLKELKYRSLTLSYTFNIV